MNTVGSDGLMKVGGDYQEPSKMVASMRKLSEMEEYALEQRLKREEGKSLLKAGFGLVRFFALEFLPYMLKLLKHNNGGEKKKPPNEPIKEAKLS